MDYIQFEQPGKKIFLCDMRPLKGARFSPIVEKGISKMLRANKPIVIIVPKKGYASGVICQDCGYIPQCDHCSVPIAYHKDPHHHHFIGLCHLCKKQYAALGTCPQCHGHALQSYGIGEQQVTERVESTYGIRPAVIHSDIANSPRKVTALSHLLTDQRIVVGTSLLMTPAQAVDASLVIVLTADQGLYMPDYQSNRNVFAQLHTMIQMYRASTFLLQTYTPDHPVLHAACRGDIDKMQTWELANRQRNDYPPYGELCVFMYKNEIEQRVYTTVHKLYQELLFLQQQHPDRQQFTITATPPLVYKMYNKYRYHLIIKGHALRPFINEVIRRLQISRRGFKIDRMPQNIV